MRVGRACLRAGAVLAAGLLISACGGDDDASTNDTPLEPPNVQSDEEQPAPPNVPSGEELPAPPNLPPGSSPELREAMIEACEDQAAQYEPEIREVVEEQCQDIG